MDIDTKDFSRRMATINGYNKEKRYYVYALCDKRDIPFYIGKGEGSRVLAHREELENEEREIDKEKLSKEEREQRKEEWTDKKKKIYDIGEENVHHIIIKYGLTEHEALMAESALINMLKYIDADLLTNIVNGHASEMEKCSPADAKTCARSIPDFIKECAPDKIEVNTISKDVLDKSMFISFNSLYPYCNGKEDIWDAVRGEWTINIEKAKKIEYVFAMHNQIIKAVFQVEPGEVSSIMSDDNSKMPKRPQKYEPREKEFDLAQDIAAIVKEEHGITVKDLCTNNRDSWNKKYEIPFLEDETKFEKWVQRGYFTGDMCLAKVYNSTYENKIVVYKGKPLNISQRGFRYGKNLK